MTRIRTLLMVAALAGSTASLPAKAEDVQIVHALLQPFKECGPAYANNLLDDGCLVIKQPEKLFTRQCKNGEGLCTVSWEPPKTNWPEVQALPPVEVRPAYMHRQKGKRVASIAQVTEGPVTPAPSTNAIFARDVGRRFGIMGAQQLAYMAGGTGYGIGACALMTFGFMVQDGVEAKEHWLPHEIGGNLLISGVLCTPVGFLLRAAYAKTPAEKAAILAGGPLGFIPGVAPALGAQIIPATPAIMSRLNQKPKAVRQVEKQKKHGRQNST